MRVSSNYAHLLSPQNPPETQNAKRERTKRSVRSLSAASYQSPVDSRDEDEDDVFFLADCDADVAESLLPRDFDVTHDDEISSFILSLTELRENEWDENESTVQAMPPFTVGAGCVPLFSSSSCSRRSRVRFAPDLVSAVVEIPSHRSLTAEQKRCLYRNKRTLQTETDISYLERDFERSRYCIENVLEEKYFFQNHVGELTHPAHWVAFVRDIVPYLVRDTSVPDCLSLSLDEYNEYLSEYDRLYDEAVQRRVFPSFDDL